VRIPTHFKGESIKNVALEYGISLEGARQILNKYCENKDKDAYLHALYEKEEILMAEIRALFGTSPVPDVLRSLCGLQTKSKPKYRAKTLLLKILRKNWLYFIADFQTEDLDRFIVKFPKNKFLEIYPERLRKFLVKSKNKAYLTYNELNHFISYNLKIFGSISSEIFDHELEIVEILNVELIDENRERVIEDFVKATKKNKKVSKYELKILNRLIGVVRQRGYITHQELVIKDFINLKMVLLKKYLKN
jgi:hypothetical protein